MDKQKYSELFFNVSNLMIANKPQEALKLVEPYRNDPDVTALYTQIQDAIENGVEAFLSSTSKDVSKDTRKPAAEPAFLEFFKSLPRGLQLMLLAFALLILLAVANGIAIIFGQDQEAKNQIFVALGGLIFYLFMWVFYIPRWQKLIDFLFLRVFQRRFHDKALMLKQGEEWVLDQSSFGQLLKLMAHLLWWIGVLLGLGIAIAIVYLIMLIIRPS